MSLALRRLLSATLVMSAGIGVSGLDNFLPKPREPKDFDESDQRAIDAAEEKRIRKAAKRLKAKSSVPKSNEAWVVRPEFNWCPNCWFNAKFESKEKSEKGIDGNIYSWTRFLCLHCGFYTTQYPPDTLALLRAGQYPKLYDGLEKEMPRHFTDEEWQLYWEKNFKEKE